VTLLVFFQFPDGLADHGYFRWVQQAKSGPNHRVGTGFPSFHLNRINAEFGHKTDNGRMSNPLGNLVIAAKVCGMKPGVSYVKAPGFPPPSDFNRLAGFVLKGNRVHAVTMPDMKRL
jgi:hypothetical protein